MRRWLGVTGVLFLIACTACAGDDAPGADARTTNPASMDETTTSVDPAASTDESTTNEPDPVVQPVVGGPGLATLAEIRNGRVEVRGEDGNESAAPNGTADVHDEGRILVFDRDPSFDAVLDGYLWELPRRSAGIDTEAARGVLPEGDPMVQRATLADLLASAFVPTPSGLYPSDRCTEQVDAVRTALLTRPPDPVWEATSDDTEVWVVTAPEVVDLPICVDEEDGWSEIVLRLERDVEQGRLQVSIDPGIYAEPRFEPLLVVQRLPGDVTTDAPASPPTTIFDQSTVFLLAINECGALPWAYSDFMAGNSYWSPADDDYVEPGPFTSAYVCEDEVPDR